MHKNTKYLTVNIMKDEEDHHIKKKYTNQGFLGVPGVGNPPANAGDAGYIPDPGRLHMLWGS